MDRRFSYAALLSIIGLSIFGMTYVLSTPTPDPTVVITITAALAGLGGYHLKQGSRWRDDR